MERNQPSPESGLVGNRDARASPGLRGFLLGVSSLLLVLPAVRAQDARVVATSGVPEVELDSLNPRARERIRGLQLELEDLASRQPRDARAVAEAWGALARVYLAYDYVDAAIRALREAAALDSSSPAWPYYLGAAASARGELVQASRHLRRALDLAPHDVPTLIRLAEVKLGLGETETARGLYQRAVALAPEVAAAHAGLGRIAAMEGRHEEAARFLERALELEPEATALHYQLGRSYRAMGNEAKARAHLDARGDGTPGFPDPLQRAVDLERLETAFAVTRELAEESVTLPVDEVIGFAVAQFGDLAGAIDAFEDAVQGASSRAIGAESRARMHFVLGALHAQAGRSQEARQHYEDALAADPHLTGARVALAWALRQQNESDAALEALDAVLDENPSHRLALIRRADLLAERGDLRAALADLERIMASAEADAPVWLRHAELLERAGRRGAALVSYEKALALPMDRADRAIAERRLAVLLVLTGKVEAAVEHLGVALQLDPGFHRARLDLGAALLRLRKLEEARQAFGRARRQRPDDPRAWLGEASAFLMADLDERALEVLDEALQRHPDDVQIRGTLARLLTMSEDLTVRDGRRAVDLARGLVAEHPSAENRETLAMALAERGTFDEAERLQEVLLQEAESAGDTERARRLASVLDLYRRGKTCCGTND